MKIGIPRTFGEVLPLLINLALALQKNGEEVFFIDPEPRAARLFRKYGLTVLYSRQVTQGAVSEEVAEKLKELAAGVERMGKPGGTRDLERQFISKRALYAEHGINCLLIWNGVLSVDKIAGRDLGLDCIFFENGYFPNTLQLDRQGVNSAASFASLDFESFMTCQHLPDTADISRHPVEAVQLHPLQCLANTGMVLRDPGSLLRKVRLYAKKAAARRAVARLQEDRIVLPERFVFIPFQVHDDTQILFNSPLIGRMEEILDLFYGAIQSVLPDYAVVVKEHPYDLGRYSYDAFRTKYPDVIWLKKFPFDQILEQAEFVITVNSSCGLQALAEHKKVMVLGDCFYRNNPFVEAVGSADEFPEKLTALRDKTLEPEAVDHYIRHFKKNIFVPGGLKNFDAETLACITAFIRS